MTTEEIKIFAKTIGVDLIGFTDASPLKGIEEKFLKRKLNNQISELGPNSLEEKTSPIRMLDSCKSIITIGIPYELTDYQKANKYGHMSSGGIGTDYHKILWSSLEKIVEYIEKNSKEKINYKICVDTCPLSDRAIAFSSGIGYYGKNNFIISKKYGSAINIGYILIDKVFLKAKDIMKNQCGTCTLCIDSCPGQAIVADGFEINQCISQLTQTKKELSYFQRELMDKNIYGCDICQRVCPKNADVSTHNTEQSQIDLIDLIHLSNSDFKNKFKDRGFSWRGNSVIKRNAIIALGNEQVKENYDELLFLLDHPSVTLKKYTLWALYKSDKKRFNRIDITNKDLAIEKERILEYYKKKLMGGKHESN
ncbi:MAG TPA: tRNA epoxyqueuosine(34) reductase QueG [Clostridia bacterium]|nr:tRNA epoxyqueuosine(34) reductase QueG [Clostridia bacterium]